MTLQLSVEALINLAILALLTVGALAFAFKSIKANRQQTLDRKQTDLINRSFRDVQEANSIYAKQIFGLTDRIADYEIAVEEASKSARLVSENAEFTQNRVNENLLASSAEIRDVVGETSRQFSDLQGTLNNLSRDISRSRGAFQDFIGGQNYEEAYLRANPANGSQRFQEQIERVSADTEDLKKDLYETLVHETMGLSLLGLRQRRYVPLRIYISNDDPHSVDAVARSLTNYAASFGFSPVADYPPEGGSWFKRWIAKSKDVLDSDETREVFRKGQRSIELSALDKKRAEVNRENAQAAGDFLRSIEGVDKVVAQFGSLLIVKQTIEGESSVVTRVLTEPEMEVIENNQGIMKDANSILDRLANAATDRMAISKRPPEDV